MFILSSVLTIISGSRSNLNSSFAVPFKRFRTRFSSETPGSSIIILKRNIGVTPTQQYSKTIFFADGAGKLSWFNGNASYQRTFDATGITAARTWTLPNADTTLAGLAVANVFTAKQSFPASTDPTNTSINFGLSGTGINGNNTQVVISIAGSNVLSITSGGITSVTGGNIALGSRSLINSPSNGNLSFFANNGTTYSNIAFAIPTFKGTNTTGSGAALLGANSPAVTLTAPYTWIQAVAADGSTVYIPAWK